MLDVLVLTGNMEDGMVPDSANEERIYCPEYIKKYGERLHCGIRITSNTLILYMSEMISWEFQRNLRVW